MGDIAIKFENISKQYRLGTIGTGTLSHDLKRWWTINILRREDPYLKIGQENKLTAQGARHSAQGSDRMINDYIWALRDINLEVRQGEVLGIIGKNGAGKSTLLKILSRVTSPTTGQIMAKGRIASLLEVGTGFHMEMTGRENIYMNGSIMGMTKAEIRRKMDEIVEFSGVESYIDTPVKRYSSGMMVRLGFAIAAHLEPEILVVDEVLAVGDAEFQKKAIGKMKDISNTTGRTVLFVSHNMGAISSLCPRCLLINNGQIMEIGDSTNVILKYYSSDNSNAAFFKPDNHKNLDKDIEIISGWIENDLGQVQNSFGLNEEFLVCLKYKILKDQKSIPVPNFHFFSYDGNYAFVSQPNYDLPKKNGTYIAKCKIPQFFFNNRTYFVGLAITSYHEVGYDVNFFETNALSFIIKDEMNYHELRRYNYAGEIPGMMRPLLNWEKYTE
jgi:lipopolysaccharide transport system ATP-binding protein